MKVTFRINEKKDKDIYDAISNAKDVTKEIKKYIRRGLRDNVLRTVELDDSPPLPSKWEIPKSDLKSNLMKNEF